MQRRSTRGPGQGVDHALVARRRVDSRQRVCVPDLDGSVKTSRGQQVRIVRLEFAVKDCLNVTLEDTTVTKTQVSRSPLSRLVSPACYDRQYQVSQEVPLLGAHVVEANAPVHEAANSLARGQREGLVLRQCWRRHCLAGGAGVLTFTRRTGTLSCGRTGKRRFCFFLSGESQVALK